jgi:hypothetical protein
MPATIIDIAKKKKCPESLDGRVYMLDITKARTFQCGGFCVNAKNFIATATKQTQVEPIKKALKEGILTDITDNDLVKTGFKVGQTSTSPVETNDTGNMAFVKKLSDGRKVLVVPKDEEHRERIKKQIAETGDFELEASEDDTSSLSGITVEPVKEDKQRKPRKAKRKIIIK